MAFNNDGTKMYMIGFHGKDVNVYGLSTAFDISTASYAHDFSPQNKEFNPSDLTFNNDE